MSTLVHEPSLSKRIRSIDDLHGYFQAFSRSKTDQMIGIECELFGVDSETGKALPYSGRRGIERLLKELAYAFGYDPIYERDHVIALQRGKTLISLEPGGQVELSAEPVRNLHEAKAQLDQFFFELKTAGAFIGGVTFLACGLQPFSGLDEIEWVPKRRYEIMADYLIRKGKRAHDMMKRTASNQINLDYRDEEDAIGKMRLALRLTPFVSAMFAHSGFALGRPGTFLTERLRIWRETDPERCGLILNLACPTCTFREYLEYVLDVPMMFVVRQKKWLATPNLTFRKFIERGFRGIRPTLEDFELHLSTIFTDARFKQYLEIRGMDGQRTHLIPAAYAFWKGILYNDEARRDASRLSAFLKDSDLFKVHRDVERLGLNAKVRGHLVLDLARELVRISETGLERQRALNSAGEDERLYLVPLKEEILARGKTPAEQLIDFWKRLSRPNPKSVIEYLQI